STRRPRHALGKSMLRATFCHTCADARVRKCAISAATASPSRIQKTAPITFTAAQKTIQAISRATKSHKNIHHLHKSESSGGLRVATVLSREIRGRRKSSTVLLQRDRLREWRKGPGTEAGGPNYLSAKRQSQALP